MKAVKEALTPTRVKLTVEVPFEELAPALAAAYKKIASQVRVQGFRPGKVPPRIIDQRVGRATVLDEAVNDALPRLYSDAASEQELRPVAQPTVDVTSFADGEPLVFTAEVDVRPEFELPDYDGLAVTVDAVTVTDDDVAEQLDALRQRFGTLEGVDRPVESGDFVSIDLAAERDGTPLSDATTSGLSYEVGSDSLVPGLDDALVGLAPDASATFESELMGEAAGPAQVTVTVRSVRKQVLPELDDDFATTASEFDTLDELKTAVRERAASMKQVEQGMQARDRTLETLLDLVDIPLPEAAVENEVEGRLHNMGHELEGIGQTLESYLSLQGKDRAEFDAELREGSSKSVKSTFVLDAVAAKEELGISDEELTDQVVRRAQRAGVEPQQYANQLMQAGQLPMLVSEIVRGKALALVMEAAVVTDTEGHPVDLDAIGGGPRPDGAAAAPSDDVAEDAAAEEQATSAAGDDEPAGDAVVDTTAE
ncbi:MAG TPA: trigger factor [Mycobacteriales bacterium]